MKYLFVYEHLKQGGIETLIIRMSKWLVENNHDVILYLEKGGALVELLDKRVRLLIKDKQFCYIFNSRVIFEEIGITSLDCIYTFGPQSCLIGGIIYSSLSNREMVNFFSGIYHPHEFNIRGHFTFKNICHSHFFKEYLNSGTHVFMSREVKSGIEKTIDFSFNNGLIWPLPISIPSTTFTGKPVDFKIVSIGRYVEFKSYNLYMFDIIKSLNNRGFHITWEVYGSGPLKEKMIKLASNIGLEGRIKINDEIQYNKIPDVLKDASVFIGMGTTILEAGAYGVPTIPAIAYSSNPTTYGLLYDLPYYSLGERLEKKPSVQIIDEIVNLYSLNDTEYEAIRNRTREYVFAYGIDSLMNTFVDFTEKKDRRLKVKRYPIFRKVLYFTISYYSFYRYKLAIRQRYLAARKSIINLRASLKTKY